MRDTNGLLQARSHIMSAVAVGATHFLAFAFSALTGCQKRHLACTNCHCSCSSFSYKPS